MSSTLIAELAAVRAELVAMVAKHRAEIAFERDRLGQLRGFAEQMKHEYDTMTRGLTSLAAALENAPEVGAQRAAREAAAQIRMLLSLLGDPIVPS